MFDALRNHQPINAVGGEVFHVAVEQAGPFAIEHAVTIADYRADCRARAAQAAIAHATRLGTQVRIAVGSGAVRLDLVRKWELIDGDLVLVGMPGPGAVKATVRL